MKRFNHFSIAYKKIDEEKFKVVPNPKYGWAADPFLVEYRDEIYLFAEIFLYNSERNGVIGYCRYNGDGFSEWQITMDKHWHLSYPNVFVVKDELYMCPESYQAGEVAIYRLLEFPDKWEKVKTIVDNVEYCDSTFIEVNNEKYMFTYERSGSFKRGRGLLCKLSEDGIHKTRVISESSMGNRPAGNVLVEDGKYIRVAQYSKDEYGQGLMLFQIDSFEPIYKEHEIKCVMPQDIKVDFAKNIVGIHTYNRLKDIEVIDVKYREFSLREYIAQKRVRKIFLNKY
ncbi:hypothetical protein SAMN02910453_1984 [Lachnospiraceae bacterium A10]|nr:hypothetical protein SAMN02910453_1984 [Lachnospiraceae bacterium A10]